nr:M14 family zinc carboxypeptidase [Modestobacter marinus]
MLAGTAGPAGDTDIGWTTADTVAAKATSKAGGTNTDTAAISVSRAVPTPGVQSLALTQVERVTRLGRLIGALRPAPSRTLPTPPWDLHPNTPATLAEEATYLSELDAASPRVHVVTIGTSALGRPIRAVLVGPPRTRDKIRATNVAMVMGGHHGDEWAGREAIFSHMRDHAAGNDTETIVYLPTVNPDGFLIPDRRLANGIDPNRLWNSTGANQTTNGTAYQPEQQAVRQAILAWHPRLILDTHEYGAPADSTSGILRFDPGTVNPTGTPAGVVSAAGAVLAAMKTAATDAGHTTARYNGSIPDDGATQAWKRGGIPSVFTESPQDASAGLALRRAQQLTTLAAFQTYMRDNAATLASLAAAATWYSGYTPTI